MDKPARDVVVMLLECLRVLDKRRQAQLASLTAVVMVLSKNNPDFRDLHRKYEQKAIDALSAPSGDIDRVYAGLIELLKSPGPIAEDQQEKLRRLLEAFEGPPQ